jgi:hypothetical protein
VLTPSDYIFAGSTLVLSVMGAYVALKPPKERYHWYWFGAFILAGLSIAGSNLWQLSEAKSEPNVGMEFANPQDVSFRIVNLSDVALRDPKYTFFLMDFNRPVALGNGVTAPNILPIPSHADPADFLRPKQKFLYRAIVSSFPAVKAIVKLNDRILGWVAVSCPNCERDRTYIVSFVNGSGGWYGEIPDASVINIPQLFANTDDYLDRLLPVGERIEIHDPTN